MRIVLKFELENEMIPKDYRRGIISIFKNVFSSNKEVDDSKYYNERDPIMKPYAFATRFQIKSVTNNEFVLKRKDIEVVVTTGDLACYIDAYNSFLRFINKTLPFFNNKITLKNVFKLKERHISEDEVVIKFVSPLLVRNYENKSLYHDVFDERFLNTLKSNLKYSYKGSEYEELIDGLQIEPVIYKKTVVLHYGNFIDGNNGIYKLSANPKLLNELYTSGFGSRKSAGFGVFDVV